MIHHDVSVCLAYRRSRYREESPGCASFGDEFRRSGGGLALRVIHAEPPEFTGFQPAGATRPVKRFRAQQMADGPWRSWRLGVESVFWLRHSAALSSSVVEDLFARFRVIRGFIFRLAHANQQRIQIVPQRQVQPSPGGGTAGEIAHVPASGFDMKMDRFGDFEFPE